MTSIAALTGDGDGYRRFNNPLSNVTRPNNIDLQINLPNDSINGPSDSSFLDSNMAHTEIELNSGNGYYQRDDDNSDMIYHEAAIYLEEGENNEKFDSHPHESEAMLPYLLVHNTWFYSLDLVASIILLALALSEDPAVDAFDMPVFLHVLIELLCLTIISVELILKLRWIGWVTLLKHKRTALKGFTLVIMVLEAIVVLFRLQPHFRITRALRPIFLVDTHHLGGVRRFIRQILQSLPPIFDMLILIMSVIFLYAIFGFFIFSDHNNYFATLYDSVVSMFVLVTTANFPDIMMPSYSVSRWNSLFFIAFICTALYLLMNLMLAVVCETFTSIEKEKMKKLYLHKLKGCELAFNLLAGRNHVKQMRYRQFQGLMKYYQPNKSDLNVLIMFKYLNTSGTGTLSKDEFSRIYDASVIKWRQQYDNIPWYHTTWMPLQNTCQFFYTLTSSVHFEYFYYVVILLNGIVMFDRAFYQFESGNLQSYALAFSASWDSVAFATLFSIEVIMKMMGMGRDRYFQSGWNVFDFFATTSFVFSIFILWIKPSAYYVIIFRPLKLFRLFKIKKRYRDIMGTVTLLFPFIRSAIVVILVVYYFFAIIGMELFADTDMRDCCQGTAVEDFYQFKETNGTALGYYYLNTFSNLAVSEVTLFELMVAGNWFVIMNAYAIMVHPFTRVYFITFYLFTMVVLTIVVASILEAFRFRIQFKKQASKRDEEQMLREEVDIRWNDVLSLAQDFPLVERLQTYLTVGGNTTFIGVRPRTRDVLQNFMYLNEIRLWQNDANVKDVE